MPASFFCLQFLHGNLLTSERLLTLYRILLNIMSKYCGKLQIFLKNKFNENLEKKVKKYS